MKNQVGETHRDIHHYLKQPRTKTKSYQAVLNIGPILNKY